MIFQESSTVYLGEWEGFFELRTCSGIRLWYLGVMKLQNSVMPKADHLRPVLYEEIDKLSDGDVEVLCRVALQLEMDHLTQEVEEEFDDLRTEGKLGNINKLIKNV